MAQDPGALNPDSIVLLQEGDDRKTFNEQVTQNAFSYQIKGRPAFAWGDIYLNEGQKIIADSNALLWMDGDVEIDTNMAGGLFAAWMRSCSGESCCFNGYTGTQPNQKVSVGFNLPGDMMAFGVTENNGWVFSYDAFVAGTNNLSVASRFSGCCACAFADESIFLTSVKVKNGETGVVLAGGYGMIERQEVPENEELLVSRGLFFAAREDASFDVGLIGQECGGICNLCCANGGIVYKFKGPCVVYTQSKNPIQLLKDFGVPGGKDRALSRGGAAVCHCASGACSAAGNAGGGAGGGGD